MCMRVRLHASTAWCSEIGSLTSLDACNSGASRDVRGPNSLHQTVCMSNSHEVSGTCRVHTKSNKSPSTQRRERCHREKTERRKIPIINKPNKQTNKQISNHKQTLSFTQSTSMARKCSELEDDIFNKLTIGG